MSKYRIEERQYRDETEFVVQEFHKGRNQYEDRTYCDNLKDAKEVVAAYKDRDDRYTVRKTIIHEQ